MRFRIHRGTKEIGGNCIELQSGSSIILLDLGQPLNAAKPSAEHLPSIAGLEDGSNADLLGIIISHPHIDHFGLLPYAASTIPVHIGSDAKRILEAAAPFLGSPPPSQSMIGYFDRRPFEVGPFKITPFLMDHSAFDAYALLVEAGGYRLFYSGDFRGHGRKSQAFEAFLRQPPSAVDALLMEGTNIGRRRSEPYPSEADLESEIARSMSTNEGIVLANFSGQNIDRLVTFFEASKRANRTLIVDVYVAHILRSLGINSLPTPSPSDLRVYLPKRQKARIIRMKLFDLVEPFRAARIYERELSANPNKWTMLFRTSMIEELEAMRCLKGGALIYSLWPGYLERDRHDLRHWAEEMGLQFIIHHTSGHAHLEDLRRFAEAIRPKALIPIHTVEPGEYRKIYDGVIELDDGEWLDMSKASN